MPDTDSALTRTRHTAGRVANRAKRELTARVGPVRSLVQRHHSARLDRYRPHLPEISGADRELVTRLESDGTVVTTLDALGLEGLDELRAGLDTLVTALRERPRADGRPLRPTRAELLGELEVWRWGLQDRLLDLAENHIGLPVRYYGSDVRCELANGTLFDVRQWHRDVEDHRVFKILVWLNDVDDDGGPFEHIDRAATVQATRALHYVSGFVTDPAMARAMPAEHWRTCTGPTGTAVVTDTARVFHRAKPPTARDRYSVTFTWTSRRPLKTYPTAAFTPAQAAQITAGLSPRQIASLPPALGGSITE